MACAAVIQGWLEMWHVTDIIGLLETFNGDTFLNLENNEVRTGAGVPYGDDYVSGGDGNDVLIDDNPLGEMANLAGGAEDDLYQLDGAGDINVYDNEGSNTFALSASDTLEGAALTLDTGQTGYVITLTNGRKLNIQNGLMRGEAINDMCWKHAA